MIIEQLKVFFIFNTDIFSSHLKYTRLYIRLYELNSNSKKDRRKKEEKKILIKQKKQKKEILIFSHWLNIIDTQKV